MGQKTSRLTDEPETVRPKIGIGVPAAGVPDLEVRQVGGGAVLNTDVLKKYIQSEMVLALARDMAFAFLRDHAETIRKHTGLSLLDMACAFKALSAEYIDRATPGDAPPG